MATNNKYINCGLLNIQSVGNKTETIRELIKEKSFDIFALCETWLNSDDKTKIGKMLPSTHTFHHTPRPRQDTKGYGGVGIFLSKSFTHIRKKRTGTFSSFEYLNIDFNHNCEKIKFIVVYRPPDFSKATFTEEFQDLLNTLVNEPRKVYICGDFNLWLDDQEDRDAKCFLELMDSVNYTNKVMVPTSRSGHILQPIFCDTDICNTKNIQVEPDFSISYYHKLVTFELDLRMKTRIKKTITFRNKNSLQPDLLISNGLDILNGRKDENCACNLERSQKTTCCNCLADIYNNTLRSEYEKMCPLVNKEITVSDQEPWMNSTIKELRKERRSLEKKWRKRRTTESREQYTQKRNEVNRKIKKRKEEYWRTEANKRAGNMKKLSVLFNNLLGNTKEIVLPEYTPELAQNFADFFEEKIDNIYNSFSRQNTRVNSLPFPFSKFSYFERIDLANYKKLVINAKKSHCESDPLPISDLMDAPNIDEILKMQMEIINLSLTEGVFPNSEKTALIKPTFKNNLEPQNLSSYRPVSNLTFLSKMIETAALQQLNEHLSKFNILPENQSAYRKQHSTETALCAVVNDLLKHIDEGKCSMIILLDLSAAFDTVEHELLFEDLVKIGIDGMALKWFKNYLTSRHFQVAVKNTKSESKPLTKGVPQGSVLGPILFCIYILELAYILHKHGIEFQFYADDTQFYFTIKNVNDTQRLIDEIMLDISKWMSKKRLKLNENKTVCLLIGSTHNLKSFNDFKTVWINGNQIPISDKTRDLGVIIDENLTMHSQIHSVVKSANFQLKNIAQIKRYLDQDCLKMLVNNLIINRIDYCNSLYYKLPDCLLKKLQNVLNRAARLITGRPPWERITPTLIELHWLPIKARIIFKICALTYQALKTQEPRYLKKKLHKYHIPEDFVQTRHSTDQHRLDEPRANSGMGARAFAHSAPRLYNKLPTNIKESENIATFKKKMKTYLFNDCYNLHEKTINEQYKIT